MKSILFYEPQCVGFEHVQFNAALIRTFQEAFPGSRVSFRSELRHRQEVQKVLLAAFQGPDVEGISWEETRAIPQRLGWCSFVREVESMSKMLHLARTRRVDLLVLCSVTPSALVALKLLLQLQRWTIPLLVITHGMLTGLVRPRSKRIWRWPLDIRHGVSMPAPLSVKLVTLAEPIFNRVLRISFARPEQWAWLRIPCIWPRIPNSDEPEPTRIRFGSFGVNAGGVSPFFLLAREIQQGAAKAEFVLAGWARQAFPSEAAQYISGISYSPLSQEEYTRRARSLTYCVSAGDPIQYSMTASASFLDALAFGVPGLYLRNPFVEDCFQAMGDIGYLWETQDQLCDQVREIVNSFPQQRHRRQKETILQMRRMFDPTEVAAQARSIVGGILERLHTPSYALG